MTTHDSNSPAGPMRRMRVLAAAPVLVLLAVTGVAAQHDSHAAPQAGHQGATASDHGQPAQGAGSNGMPMMAGGSCPGGGDMHSLLGALSTEVEKARQTNSAAAMRSALESVQAGLAKVREHMSGCAAHMGGSPSAAAQADHSAHTAARVPALAAPTTMVGKASPPATADEAKAAWTIEITSTGYEPASIAVKAGVKATLTFIRKTDQTCGTEIVFPDFKIEKELPLNTPVVVEVTPTKTGEFRFTCGMNMYDGKMVVR